MNVSARLFDVLYAKSDIGHPICMECTSGTHIRSSSKRSVEEKLQAEKEYQAIKAKEALAIQSLRDMEKERARS